MHREPTRSPSILATEIDVAIERELAREHDPIIALPRVLSLAAEVVDVAAIAVVAVEVHHAEVARVGVAGERFERTFPSRWRARSREVAGDACRALACEVGVATPSEGAFDVFLPCETPRPVICAALGDRTLTGILMVAPSSAPGRAHVHLAELLRRPLTAWLARRGWRASRGLAPSQQRRPRVAPPRVASAS